MNKKLYNSPVTEDVLVSPMGMMMAGSGPDKPGAMDDPEPTIPIPGSAPRKPF